ncbi:MULTISPECIES: DotI/IcmL/TraM family protein [unclassified Thioalkalivibrio]|uniref:DotI/IcmL/TraM family protein n=1 Tax=unclassified Thioalkalivibrio TaxID=2621013 RepID=UPI00037277AD|nr:MULTISPECIES: DotI/IcmL/TraM family protein [unclassified Thioalkalivibrio]
MFGKKKDEGGSKVATEGAAATEGQGVGGSGPGKGAAETKPGPQRRARKQPDDSAFASAIKSILFRDSFRVAVRVLTVSMVVNVVLALGIIYVGSQDEPAPRYFATNPDGTLTEMTPLSRPNLTDTTLRNWAGMCVTEAWTMGFHDLDRRITQASDKCFTESGATAYRNALIRSETVSRIQSDEIVMNTTLNGSPIIVDKGESQGRLAWQIRVPVVETIRGADIRTRTRERTIVILAVRSPTLEHPHGVAINQFIFE